MLCAQLLRLLDNLALLDLLLALSEAAALGRWVRPTLYNTGHELHINAVSVGRGL